MQEKSKRSLVFGIVALVAVGSTIASAGIGDRARGELDEARARWAPASGEAKVPAPIIPEYRLGRRDLEAARAWSASGERPWAALALTQVLARADRMDRMRSLGASLVAAKLLDGVADLVDRDPALLADVQLRAALRRTSFASSRTPLRGERSFALAQLAGLPSLVPVRTLGLAEHESSRMMNDADAALRAMEDAAVAGDVARCEEVARAPSGFVKRVVVGPSICRHATEVVASGRRFERLQLRAASLHADPRAPRMARVLL